MTRPDDRTPHWRRAVPWWRRGGALVAKPELTAALMPLQAQVDELRLRVERLEAGPAEARGTAPG